MHKGSRLGVGLTRRALFSHTNQQITRLHTNIRPFSSPPSLPSPTDSYRGLTALRPKAAPKVSKSTRQVSKKRAISPSLPAQPITSLKCLAPYAKQVPYSLSAAPFIWEEFKLQQFVDFIIQANPRDIYADTPLTANAVKIPPNFVQHPRVELYQAMSKRSQLEMLFEGVLRFFGTIITTLVRIFNLTPLRILYPYLETLINNSHLYYKIDEWLYLTPDERLYSAYLNYKLTLLYGRIISMAKMFVENKGDHQHTISKSHYLTSFDMKHPNDALLLIEHNLDEYTPEYQLFKAILDDFNSHLLDLQMDSIISTHIQQLQQLDFEKRQQEELDAENKRTNQPPSTIPSSTPYSVYNSKELLIFSKLLDPTTNTSLILSSSSLPIAPTSVKPEAIQQQMAEHSLLYQLARDGPFPLGSNGLPVYTEWEPDWTEHGKLDPFSDDILPDYDPCLWTTDPETHQVVMRQTLWKRGFDSLYSSLKSITQEVSPLQNPQLLQEGTSLRIFHPHSVKFPRVPELVKLLTTDILQYQIYRDGYPFFQSHGHLSNVNKPYRSTAIGEQDLLTIEKVHDPKEIDALTTSLARQALFYQLWKSRPNGSRALQQLDDLMQNVALPSQSGDDIDQMVKMRNTRALLKARSWKIGEGLQKLDDLLWSAHLGDDAPKPSTLTVKDYEQFPVPSDLYHWTDKGQQTAATQTKRQSIRKNSSSEDKDDKIKRQIYRIKTKHEYPDEISSLQNTLYFGTEISNQFLEHDYKQMADLEVFEYQKRQDRRAELERQRKDQQEIRRQIKLKELHTKHQKERTAEKSINQNPAQRQSQEEARLTELKQTLHDDNPEDNGFDIESRLPPVSVTTLSYGKQVQKNKVPLLKAFEAGIEELEFAETVRQQYFPHIHEDAFHLYTHAIALPELHQRSKSDSPNFLAPPPRLPPQLPESFQKIFQKLTDEEEQTWTSPMDKLLQKLRAGEIGLTLEQIKEQEQSELNFRRDLIQQREKYFKQLEEQGLAVVQPDGSPVSTPLDEIIQRLDRHTVETTSFYKSVIRTISVRPKIVENAIIEDLEDQHEREWRAQQEHERIEKEKKIHEAKQVLVQTDKPFQRNSIQQSDQTKSSPPVGGSTSIRKQSVHPKDFDETLKEHPELDSSIHLLPNRADRLKLDDLQPFQTPSDYVGNYRRRDTFNKLKPVASIFKSIETDEKIQDVNLFAHPPQSILSEPQNARLIWILQPLYDMTPRELIDMYDLLSAHQTCMTALPFDGYSHYEYLLYKKRTAQNAEYPLVKELLATVQLESLIAPVYNPTFRSPQYQRTIDANRDNIPEALMNSNQSINPIIDFLQQTGSRAFTPEVIALLNNRFSLDELEQTIPAEAIEDMTSLTDVIDEHVQILSAMHHRRNGTYMHKLHGLPNHGTKNLIQLPNNDADLQHFEEFYRSIPVTDLLMKQKASIEFNEMGSDETRAMLLGKAIHVDRSDHIYEDSPSVSTPELQAYDKFMMKQFEQHPHDDFGIENIGIHNTNPTFQLLFHRTRAAVVKHVNKLTNMRQNRGKTTPPSPRQAFAQLDRGRDSYYGAEGDITRQQVIRDLETHDFMHYGLDSNPLLNDFDSEIHEPMQSPITKALLRPAVDNESATHLANEIDQTLRRMDKKKAERGSRSDRHVPIPGVQQTQVPPKPKLSANKQQFDLNTNKLFMKHQIYEPTPRTFRFGVESSPTSSQLDILGTLDHTWNYLFHDSLLAPLLQWSIAAIIPDFIRTNQFRLTNLITSFTTPSPSSNPPPQGSPIDFSQPIPSSSPLLNEDESTITEVSYEDLDTLQALTASELPTEKPSERELMMFYQQHSYNFIYSIMYDLITQHITSSFNAYFTLHKAYQHEATGSAIPSLLFSNTLKPEQPLFPTNFMSELNDQRDGDDSEDSFSPTFLYGIHFPSGDPRFAKFVSESKGKDPLAAYLTYFKQQLIKDFKFYAEEDKEKLRADFGIFDDGDGNLVFPSRFYDEFDDEDLFGSQGATKTDPSSIVEIDQREKNETFVRSLLQRHGITPYGDHLLTFIELLGSDDRPLNPAVIQQVALAQPLLTRYGLNLSAILTHVHFFQHLNKLELLSSLASRVTAELHEINGIAKDIPPLPPPIPEERSAASAFQFNPDSTASHRSFTNLPLSEHPLYNAQQKHLVEPTFDANPLSVEHYHSQLKQLHYQGMKKLRERYTWLNLEDISALDLLLSEALQVSQRNVFFYRPMFAFDGQIPRF